MQVSRSSVDWRSGRAAALGLRWDREDAKNRAKFGGRRGGDPSGDEAAPWGDDPSDDDGGD